MSVSVNLSVGRMLVEAAVDGLLSDMGDCFDDPAVKEGREGNELAQSGFDQLTTVIATTGSGSGCRHATLKGTF